VAALVRVGSAATGVVDDDVVINGSVIVLTGAGGDCGVITGSGIAAAGVGAGSLATGLKKGLSD